MVHITATAVVPQATTPDLQVGELGVPGSHSSLPGVQVCDHLLHRRIGLSQLGPQPLHLVCRRARAHVSQLSLLFEVRCPSAEAPLDDQNRLPVPQGQCRCRLVH